MTRDTPDSTPKSIFPTPRTNSLCGGTGSWNAIQDMKRGGALTPEEARAMTSTGGELNPDWVEWLMGWPVGWTDPDAGDVLAWIDLPDDPADLDKSDAGYIARITTRRKFRRDRIKALGNGQVPLCAAVAFEEGLSLLLA